MCKPGFNKNGYSLFVIPASRFENNFIYHLLKMQEVARIAIEVVTGEMRRDNIFRVADVGHCRATIFCGVISLEVTADYRRSTSGPQSASLLKNVFTK